MSESNEEGQAADRPSEDNECDELTRDLERAANGGAEERNRIWQKYYPLFKQCAEEWFRNKWNGKAGSIGATHIAGEVFMRMGDRTAAMGRGRTYFFKCFYTECMRIVIDHWRASKKRKDRQVDLGADSLYLDERGDAADPEEIVALLEELKDYDEAVGMVAMVKVFESCPDGRGGQRQLTNQEVAQMLGMGLRTVEKHWAFGKAWLGSRISGRGASE